ncbi:MAG: MarR family transcriptional regulator [Methanomicrobium sp.]|nr:MarR family transcriptional regulator [Methanomicrobium sp.]
MSKKIQGIDFSKISEKWIRILDKIDSEEKTPKDFGTGDFLHRSEIHTIMAVGDNPGINVTNLSEILGISKSAISQMIKKLERKKLIERFVEEENKKEIRLVLSPKGKIAYLGHEQHHARIFAKMHSKIGSLNISEFELISGFLSAVEETFDECEKEGM